MGLIECINKKVVIVSSVYPWPVNNGKKVVLNGFLKYLVQRYGEKNVNYVCVADKKEDENIRDEISLTYFSQPSIGIKLFNVLIKSFILQTKSIQESMLYSEKIKRKLLDLINEIKPDLVLVDTIRIGQFFEKEKYWGKDNTILYMDDLFSIRYEKMIATKKIFKNIELNSIGNFKKNIPNHFIKFLKFNFVELFLLNIEKKIIRKREIKIPSYFKKSLLINSNEKNLLNELCETKIIECVTPYLAKNNNSYKRNYRGKKEFVFLGSLNLSHNRVSLIHFIKTQSEIIRQMIPGVKIKIIGGSADNALKNLINLYSDIFILEGFIPKLEDVFESTCAMIIPLLFGSGVKLKTIEAMFYGLPIITTTYGIEGIDVIDRNTCIIEDDISKFYLHMTELLEKEKNQCYSNNARKFYEDKYSSSVVYREYNKIFQ